MTVNQTLTSIVVSPTSATVNTSANAAVHCDCARPIRDQPGHAADVYVERERRRDDLLKRSVYGRDDCRRALHGNRTERRRERYGQRYGDSGNQVYQINCGGSAASPYTADQYYSGGTARTVTNSITTTGVTNPAPQAVYQAERYGTVTYTLPSLTAGASYTVRLHFAELYWTATGKRKFNVAINGTTVLSNYDIYAATGARYKAVVKEFTATANTSGTDRDQVHDRYRQCNNRGYPDHPAVTVVH